MYVTKFFTIFKICVFTSNNTMAETVKQPPTQSDGLQVDNHAREDYRSKGNSRPLTTCERAHLSVLNNLNVIVVNEAIPTCIVRRGLYLMKDTLCLRERERDSSHVTGFIKFIQLYIVQIYTRRACLNRHHIKTYVNFFRLLSQTRKTY